MANVFDQFDDAETVTAPAPVGSAKGTPFVTENANPFDRFDGADAAPSAPIKEDVAGQFGAGLVKGIPNAVTGLADLTEKGVADNLLFRDPRTGRSQFEAVVDAWGDVFSGKETPLEVRSPYKPVSGDIIRKGLDMARLNPDDYFRAPATPGERMAEMAGEGAITSIFSPNKAQGLGKLIQLGRDMIIGGGAGAAAQAGMELAPDEWDPLVGLGAGLAGGIGTAAATAVPGAMLKGLGAVGRYVEPAVAGKRGIERMAGKKLAGIAGDVPSTIEALNAADEIVPGSRPTSFQASGNVGLGSLEAALARSDDEFKGKLIERREQQNAARIEALEEIQDTGNPGLVADYFRDRMADLERTADDLYSVAERKAQTEFEGLGNRPAGEIGDQARSAIEAEFKRLNRDANQLWESIDPDGTLVVSTAPIRNAAAKMYAEMAPEDVMSLSAKEKALANIIGEYGDTIPFQRFKSLRTQINEAMRQARMSGENIAAGRLAQLRSSIEDAVGESIAGKMQADPSKAEEFVRRAREWYTRSVEGETGAGAPPGAVAATAGAARAVPEGRGAEGAQTGGPGSVAGDTGLPEDVAARRAVEGGGRFEQRELAGMFHDVEPRALNGLSREQNRALTQITQNKDWVEADMPTRRLVATQLDVDDDFHNVAARAAQRSDGYDRPMIVRVNGKNYVSDGHHRIAAAIDRGDSTVPVRFVDLDSRMSGDIPDPRQGRLFEQADIIQLGPKREQKQLEGFHRDLMGRVADRARESREAGRLAREQGIFEGFDNGARLRSQNAEGKPLPPMKVEGTFLREWRGRPGEMAPFTRMGVRPTIVEYNGKQYIPVASVVTGEAPPANLTNKQVDEWVEANPGKEWSRFQVPIDLVRDRGMRGPQRLFQDAAKATQTDLPAFKRWFGDSKVVDESGAPKVMYHGTRSRQPFTEFQPNRPSKRFTTFSERDVESQGMFFSPDRGDAESYAGRNGSVIEAYLSVQRPLDPAAMPISSRSSPAEKAAVKRAWDDLEYILAPLVDENGYIDTDGGMSTMRFDVETVAPDGFFDWAWLDNPEVVKRLKERGYDGVKVAEPNDQSGFSWFVPGPNQIKSVNNRGTFDPKNPNILYQSGAVSNPGAEFPRPFYSAALKSVEESKTNRASPQQWAATIKNTPGVKQEELDWLGLTPWLAAQKGPVTKEQIADFIRANQIEVEEVNLSGDVDEGFEVDVPRHFDWEPDDIDEDFVRELAREDAVDQADDLREQVARREDIEPEDVTDDQIEQQAFENQMRYREQEPDGYHTSVTVETPDGSQTTYDINRHSSGYTSIYNNDMGHVRDGQMDEDDIRGAIAQHLEESFERPAGAADAADGPTQYGEYTLPGGKNYHELLLKLPERKGVDVTRPSAEVQAKYKDQWDALQARYNEALEIAKNTKTPGYDAPERAALRSIDKQIDDLHKQMVEETRAQQAPWKSGENFDAPHYDDQSQNILAHVRFKDRTSVDGKRTLFLEEVQSDWHQQGRDKGYQGQEKSTEGWTAKEGAGDPASGPIWEVRDANGRWVMGIPRETAPTVEQAIRRAADSGRGEGGAGVPDAPFKTTWPELALKRMIRWAADNGYDQIAWTPGSVQNARYNLSQHINNVQWFSGKGDMAGIRQINLDAANRSRQISLVVDQEGKVVGSPQLDGAINKPLSEVVGKDLAQQIMSDAEGQISKAGLAEIGGSGMREFYDRVLVSLGNKLGKKFNTQVGKSQIRVRGQRGDEYLDVPALPITPEMRAGALRGQPLFQKAHEAATSPLNDLPQPTEAQKEAGNYKKGHVRMGGLDLSIENPAGSKRSGTDASGKAWSVDMKDHYGYIKGTTGRDKDHLDVFVSKDAGDLTDSAPVFVVDQIDPKTGKFDEAKIMLGYPDRATAEAAYKGNYARGWKGMGAITPTTVGGLKEWMKTGKTRGQFANSGFERTPSIADTMADRFAAAGRPEKEAKAAGQLVDAFYTTLAKRAGKSVEDIQAIAPLPRVEKGGAATGLKQGATPSSPEFKRWFGRSKAVDGSGKPVVVYHGTNQPIDQFDVRRGGMSTGENAGATKGFFFTDSREVADQYATNAGERVVSNIGEFEKKQARLKKEVDRLERVAQRTGDWAPYEKAMAEWEDLEIGATREDSSVGRNVVETYLSLQNPKIVDMKGGRLSAARDMDTYIDEAKAAGNDGLIVRNVEDSPKMGIVSDHYVAFRPEQIKSVNNRGTFDPRDPNIMKQGPRGSIELGRGKSPSLISLFEKSDASTALHESAHQFLDMFSRVAGEADAPKELKQDWGATRAWWQKNARALAKDAGDGVTPADVHKALRGERLGGAKDAAVARGMHEQWARAFEVYLRDGKAPNAAMKGLFDQFKDWLTQVYRSLTGMNVNVSPDIRGVFDRMLGGAEAPAPGELINKAAADRFKAASAATRNIKETFGAKPVKGIVSRPGGPTYPYAMSSEGVSNQLFKPGAEGAANIQSVLKASNNAAAAREAIEAAAVLSAKRAAGRDGVLDPAKFDAWRAKHADALRQVPALDRRFSTAKAATEAMVEMGERRAAALDGVRKSAVGKLLKVEDGADVASTVGAMLNRADAVKSMRELVAQARGDQNALDGLRRAVVDHMLTRLKTPKDALRADTFQRYLGKNTPALAQVLEPEQMAGLRAIAQDLKRATQDVRAPGGGSPTAEYLAAQKRYGLVKGSDSVIGAIIRRALASAAGWAAGHTLLGPIYGPVSSMASFLGDVVLNRFREAGIKRVDDLIKEAILDPELMKALLMKAPREKGKGSAVTLGQRLANIAVTNLALSAGQAQEKEPREVRRRAQDDSIITPMLGVRG